MAGQPQRNLSTRTLEKKKAYQREPEPGRSEEHSFGWGDVVSGKVYSVPWLNSMWHLGGHRSLIRWGFVIHECIDGYSRRIIFLHCSTNNLSPTVPSLFDSVIVIAMFLVTSPIVINVPIRRLLAIQWLANLNMKINMTSMFVNKKHRYRTRCPSRIRGDYYVYGV